MSFLQLLGRKTKEPNIEIGCRYSRCVHTGLTERAKVLAMSQDQLGIPHVQFEYRLERYGKVEMSDRRTLALEVFRGAFGSIGNMEAGA